MVKCLCNDMLTIHRHAPCYKGVTSRHYFKLTKVWNHCCTIFLKTPFKLLKVFQKMVSLTLRIGKQHSIQFGCGMYCNM